MAFVCDDMYHSTRGVHFALPDETREVEFSDEDDDNFSVRIFIICCDIVHWGQVGGSQSR